MKATKPICRFCGSDDGFDQYGEVRADAWRKVKAVERASDGKLTVSYERFDSERVGSFISEHDFDAVGFRCIECQREERKLEDLIGDPVNFSPGALVVCPDGFKGVIATVDFERRRLTVEGWHEEFMFADVDLVGVAA